MQEGFYFNIFNFLQVATIRYIRYRCKLLTVAPFHFDFLH